jgi:hypothetical protein
MGLLAFGGTSLVSDQARPVVLIGLLVSAAVLFAGSFALVRSIRCQMCGLRWFLYAVGNEPISSWLSWLLSFSSCPKCGVSTSSERRTLSTDVPVA